MATAVKLPALESDITAATGSRFRIERATPVGGGCISEALRIDGGGRTFFVKLAGAGQRGMFDAEQAALQTLAATGAVRVPDPLCSGDDGEHAWLVLEFIPLSSPGAATSVLLGEQLADLHRHTASTYGWADDNWIGANAQVNTPDTDWTAFFAHNRLGPQLELAQANGASTRLLDRGWRLSQNLHLLLGGHNPAPSLLHGDLWGGNWGADADVQPVLFDPASYYGDREADLAMAELFGGFDKRFYETYASTWPIDAGYQTRKVLYNLYHVLNHFNLFGGNYGRQAQNMIDRLLATIG